MIRRVLDALFAPRVTVVHFNHRRPQLAGKGGNLDLAADLAAAYAEIMAQNPAGGRRRPLITPTPRSRPARMHATRRAGTNTLPRRLNRL